MFVNGKSLLKAAPIKDMFETKNRIHGTSFGLSEAGYDIRISQNVAFVPLLDGKGQILVITDDSETVTQGRFTLASAIEEFQMPNYLVGSVKDKSTWARQGVSVFNTVIEPGWNGFLTLEIVFHGNEPVSILSGSGIAQVLFGRLSDEGDYSNGKYQNQEAGPQGARS